jgi:chromosomal replication initiator protein
MSVETLEKKTRKREIVKARQTAHFFAHWMKLGSLSAIGREIGWRDHATVLHSQDVINGYLETSNKEAKNEIQDIMGILEAKWYFKINNFKDERTRENLEKLVESPFDIRKIGLIL